MDSLGILAGTSVVLGAFLGAMSGFVFHLPAMVSAGIGGSSAIGLFLIMLVLNSIGFQRSTRNYLEEQ